MSDLRELYQEVILDHSKRPRNFRAIAGADRHARGHNPLCGDNITIFLKLEGDRVGDIAFQGSGCAICTASASVMTETMRGKTEKEVEATFERFHGMVTGETDRAADTAELGKLAVFAGVSEFPIRVKCASLPWHTLKAALHQQQDPITTE